MSPLFTMKRFSRSSSVKNNNNSNSNQQQHQTEAGHTRSPNSYTPPQSSTNIAANQNQKHMPPSYSGGPSVDGPHNNNARPVSAATDDSFDMMGRPTSHHQQITHQQQQQQGLSSRTGGAIGGGSGGAGGYSSGVAPGTGYSGAAGNTTGIAGGLSRTDHIVLKHFWESKFAENATRDLHYLKFPFFPQYPSHRDLLPYCEIYHLVKTSPGARIISLGSANGVYIGFELSSGAQLHIDMDDEWSNITHHRLIFKSYEHVIRDPSSEAVFKSWQKPLTIEFLEEEYRGWMLDLMSFCWLDESVGQVGGGGAGHGGVGAGRGHGAGGGRGSRNGSSGSGGGLSEKGSHDRL